MVLKTTTKLRNEANYRTFCKYFTFCLVIAFLFCHVVLNNTANAATYYLDQNGSDDANGLTVETAWQTLSKAQANVTSGDTVIVYDGNYGTYSESAVDRTDWVTYRAAEGHHPVLTKIDIYNASTVYNAYLIFDGFNVRTGDLAAFVCGVRITRSNHIRLSNLDIEGCEGIDLALVSASNSYPAIDIETDANDVIVKSCKIYTTSASQRYGYSAGVWIYRAANIEINDCNISHIWKGVGISSGTSVEVKNNDIHNTYNDGIGFGGCNGLTIENNKIHGLYVYKPVLAETPTETVWSDDGKTMSNPSAKWYTAGDNLITTQMEIEVISGTNCYTGDSDYLISSIDANGTKITLTKGIANGGTLSEVNYIIKSNSHNDGIQADENVYQYNITIRGNRIYNIGHDQDQTYMWLNPKMWVGAPIGGFNFLVENNLCWTIPATELEMKRHSVSLNYTSGAVFRNNTIIGQLAFYWNNTDLTLISNIANYVDIRSDTSFTKENYNIFNYGYITDSHILGTNTSRLFPAGSNNNWNDPAFTGIFADYTNGDFRHASATSLGVGHGDPTNYPTTDILGNSRDSSPDAGCYEYVPPDCRPIAVAYSIPFVSDVNFDGNEPVILDGSGSTAPCGSIVSYVWTEKGSQIAIGVNPDVNLSVGWHTITLQVTDNDGLTDTDTVVILVRGLYGKYKFNEGSGIYANDSTGISTAGRLLNGPIWTAQREIAFDGNNDAVEITTVNFDVNSGTIALWANPEDFSKRRHFLFGETTQHWNNRIQLYCDAMGMLCMGLGNNPDDIQILNLSPNEWYHIALVWNGMSCVVYVDGVQEATGSYSGLNTLQTYADIGNNGNRSSRKEGFDGLIDEVRLYNRPLDANEIMSLALAFLPIDDKTVAEGESLSFAIRTKSGVLTEISDENLPGMPSLVSNIFSWTPDYDDAGTYELTFTSLHLSDSNYEDFETINISVLDTQQFDPVGHWPFDEMSGNFAFDISESGNTGRLLNGLAWESGKINSAIAFSVPNDAVEIRTTGFNPNSGTTAMWVYVDRYTLSSHYLFGYTDTTDTALKNRIQLYLQYGVLCLGLGDSHETAMNIERLQIHQWYHIALTWSWGNYNVYVDGLPAASGSYSGLTGFTANAEIGNNGINRNRAFNGKIDDVYIYNRALTAAEIAQLANN